MDLLYRAFTQTSEPAEEPVTLDQAKAHLRVSGDDDDELIGDQIAAAREWVEKEVNRALVTRSYDLRFDAFAQAAPPWFLLDPRSQERPYLPIWGTIRLPKPPLVSVDAIEYLDLDGVARTLDPSAYKVVTGGRLPGWLSPAYGRSWPPCRVEMGSVVISITCGYGGRQDVPRALQRAILLMVGGLYRFREPVTDVAMIEVPFGVKGLLSTYRWKASA